MCKVSSIKILIVGSQSPASIEVFFRMGLQQLGCSVEVFEPAKLVSTSTLARLRFRFYDTGIFRRANEALVAYCERAKPDVVWIFKGIEIMPATISAIKATGALVVNYNPDHPYIRTSITHGGRNVPACVPMYDLYFSYHRELAQAVGPAGVWLPFGFHLPQEQYERVMHAGEIVRACFVGTLDRERAALLSWLTSTGVPIDVYGPINRHARKLVGLRNIRVHATVFDDDLWRVLRSYRVQLNFFRPHNHGSHNQRTFEVPAVGGILLTPGSDEQRAFFEPGSEMLVYGSPAEMQAQIDRLLSLSTPRVAEMRQAARTRSVTSGYSYAHRAAAAHVAIMQVYQSHSHSGRGSRG